MEKNDAPDFAAPVIRQGRKDMLNESDLPFRRIIFSMSNS